MQILDYSGGYPGAAAIRAAGYGGVIRYLRKEGTSRVRPITADELADMRAHGLAVALVYQAVSTDRILSGWAAGAHDARWAVARARELGIEPRCIYFAADQDIDTSRALATPYQGYGTSEMAAVVAYLDGAASFLGRDRVGIYGEHDVIETCVPRHAAYGWQTAAWSRGRRSSKAHLYQRIGQPLVGGIPVDINEVLAADFGQIDMEDDMPTAKEVAREVWRYPIHNRRLGRPEHAETPLGSMERRIRDEIVGPMITQVRGLLADLTARITADPDITPDQFARVVDESVARHTPTAQAVATSLRPMLADDLGPVLRDLFAETLAGDDAAEADRLAETFLDKLTERLAAAETGTEEAKETDR